jgi:hypothetical protein
MRKAEGNPEESALEYRRPRGSAFSSAFGTQHFGICRQGIIDG